MSDRRLNTSRIGRAGRLGGMAAGAAVRQLGTRAANTMRSEDEAEEALGRQALEMADKLVKVLGGMKGAAMKVGQTLSVIDPGMVPGPYRDEFQAKLAQLQTMAPSVSFKEMRKVIEQDLGEPLSAAFAEFDEEAIAAASIGQVYRARLHDGRDVAVKVQYPGIKDVVRADLKNLGMVLRLASRFAPGLDTKEIAQEVTERISEELDYELEAMNHRALARVYSNPAHPHPFIVVPAVITELCRERVIVTEFIEGRKFAEIRGDSDEQRSRWGEILFRFYVNGPYRHLLLNGDPHPGNSLFMADGRVAFIDFGFFKRQTREDVDDQLEILKACYAQDAERLFELTVAQGIISKRRRELVQPLMEKYRAATWWFLEDRDVTLTPKDATKILLEHGDMRKAGFGDLKLPANQIVTLRAFGLVFGILGQLQATNNWYRIGREVIFGEEPVTELGQIESEFVGVRG
ncbi:MAG TPA: AarF/ABC1/UbiB kinase family protein [Solirubrobacteraceae bacterium]|jgi:predicted unusual protein kinase regulating ubiquinone biosynthesis (AarF/ABC1/UbiB family)